MKLRYQHSRCKPDYVALTAEILRLQRQIHAAQNFNPKSEQLLDVYVGVMDQWDHADWREAIR